MPETVALPAETAAALPETSTGTTSTTTETQEGQTAAETTASDPGFTDRTESGGCIYRFVVIWTNGDWAVVVNAEPVQYATVWTTNPDYRGLQKCHQISKSSEDPLIAEITEKAKYGDIIEYTPSDGMFLSVDDMPYTGLYRHAKNRPDIPVTTHTTGDTFEVVGSVFETPLTAFYPKELDGTIQLAVRLHDGAELVFSNRSNVNMYENETYIPNPQANLGE